MSTILDTPSFHPSRLKSEACASFCEGMSIGRLDERSLEVHFPISWPDGDSISVYLEDTGEGGLVLTDWAGFKNQLYLNGIHGFGVLEAMALSQGLEWTKRGEIRKEIGTSEDIPSNLLRFLQVASVAISELAQISFQPSPLILPATWGGILAREIKAEGIVIRPSVSGTKVDEKGVMRRGPVAMQGEWPLVVSPVIRDDARGFNEVVTFLVEAVPSIRGVVPVISSRDEDRFARRREDIMDAGRKMGRGFVLDAIPVWHSEAQYNSQTHEYPAIQHLTAGVRTFNQVLQTVLGPAA